MGRTIRTRKSTLRRDILFVVLVIIAVGIIVGLSSLQAWVQSRRVIKTTRTPVELYKRLGITCEPTECDKERVLGNMTQLTVAELEAAIQLIGDTAHLASLAEAVRQQNVRSIIFQADSRDFKSSATWWSQSRVRRLHEICLGHCTI